MKKNRSRLITLTFVFICFLLIFIIKSNFNRLFPQKKTSALPLVKKEVVNQLEIRSEKQITWIYKKNLNWHLKKDGVEFLADNDRVNALIDNILALKKENIASTNKNKHRQLGIDKQFVSLKTHNKTYQVYIGASAGLSKTYLRIDNQNEVFIGENLSDVFTPDDYRDLSVHLVNNEDRVNYLEFEFDEKKLILEKKKNDWLVNNKKAKNQAVEFFINDLKTLKANDIVTKETMLSTIPELIINLVENKQHKTASVYKQDENNYLLKTSVSASIFEIPSTYITSLKKEEKDFTQ